MTPKKHGVLAFLLLSFGLAWGWILVAYVLLDLSMVNPLAQLPMAFAPAIAAVVVRKWVTREGFHDAGLRLRVPAAGRYYLVAWFGPVPVVAATVGLAIGLGLYRPEFSALGEVIPGLPLPGVAGLAVVLLMPLVLAPVFWGEEFGWRSYLQQRLHNHPLRAVLITGVVWAAWHYPAAFTDYGGYANPYFGMVSWTASIIPLAVILGWLFLRSGSVWVTCLAHAGNNLIIGSLESALLVEDGGLEPATVQLLGTVPLAAVAAWIVLTGRLRAPAPVSSSATGAASPDSVPSRCS